MAELLALLIEVTSVPASGKQMAKPVEVPRPDWTKAARETRALTENTSLTKGQGTGIVKAAATDAAYKQGLNVLAKSARGVRRG